MPIYEYRCRQCRKKFEHIHLRTGSTETVVCPHCQSRELDRLISRVRVMKSDESRMESLADPSKLSGFDEKDPQSVARWMKKMSKEMGEDLGDDVEQVVEEAMEKRKDSGSGESE
jgi:putative FmdB family regulatory protein